MRPPTKKTKRPGFPKKTDYLMVGNSCKRPQYLNKLGGRLTNQYSLIPAEF